MERKAGLSKRAATGGNGGGGTLSPAHAAALEITRELIADQPRKLNDVIDVLTKRGKLPTTRENFPSVVAAWKRNGLVDPERFIHSSTPDIVLRLRANLITDVCDKYEAEGREISIRGVWYRLIAAGHIDKDEGGKNYYSAEKFGKLVNELRDDGRISFDVISDPTRRFIIPPTWESPQDRIESAADSHTLNLWSELPDRVIVVEEKRGLEGVFAPVTRRLQVPLLATAGFNGRSMMHKICKIANEHSGPTTVLLYGDHDADGEYAHHVIEHDTREHFQKHFDRDDMTFKRCAINADQIEDLGIITRDPVTTSNRWNWWVENFGEDEPCAEIDAIEPAELQEIIEADIMEFIPDGHIESMEAEEERQAEFIKDLAAEIVYPPPKPKRKKSKR
jgi:hypothetical protein